MMIAMPDNDFWIGQEQIPVDLSLLLTYHNDEDYWYAPGEYALRVYTVDTLNTNFARPCFALGERKFDPETEDVSGAIENTLHELLDSGATPEDVYRIMGLVKESELSPETKEADSYLPIDLGYCIDGNIVSYEAVPESVATVPENVDYHQYLWVPSKYRRNSDGMKPADRKGLVGSEDFALLCWDSVNHLPAIRRISLKASLTSRLIDFKYLREAEAPAYTHGVSNDIFDYEFDDDDDDIPAFSFPEA